MKGRLIVGNKYCEVLERLRFERKNQPARIAPPVYVRLSSRQRALILAKPVAFLERFADPEDAGFLRVINTLEEQKIYTIGRLLNCRPNDLLGVANLGERTLKQLLTLLERCGFYPEPRRVELERQLREYTRLRSRVAM